jgi:hypothetical protein
MVWPRLHNLEFAPAINLSGCQVFLIPWWPLNSFDVLMATDFLGSRFQSKKMMVLFFSFYIRSVREPKMSWARNEPWRVPSVDWSQHQISDRIPSMKKDFGSTTVKDNRLLTLIKPYYVLPVVPHWWWRFFFNRSMNHKVHWTLGLQWRYSKIKICLALWLWMALYFFNRPAPPSETASASKNLSARDLIIGFVL